MAADPARQLRASSEHDHDDDGAHAAGHDAMFSTWRYESDRPFSLEALKEVVRKDLPGAIYRCKGVIYLADEHRRRAVLQCVVRRTDISLFDEWNGRKPRTRIVAIGALGAIDGKLLKEQFDACTQ